jgi:antirestriction protein ArdC
MSEKNNKDVYSRITDKIVAALEQGTRPWIQPWACGHVAGPVSRPLRGNGVPYAGINVLVLWATAMEKGYAAPIWMTFRQAKEFGAHVKKGEKGSLVVYANTITRTEEDENGEESERTIPFMKGYTVFNVEQIEGLPAHFTAEAPPRLNPEQRIARAERIFECLGADIRHGGNSAYYAPGPDHVQMPDFTAFESAESYYATLAHECTHWTRHEKRLDRDLGRKSWGDAGYAMEELVAELGAAFVCADLKLTLEPREDHAAHIAGWLKVLKEDKRAVFTAAAHAQKAADFLHSLQPEAETIAEQPQEEAA